MKKKIFLIPLLIVIVLFSGCKTVNKPTPEQTISGVEGDANNSRWVNSNNSGDSGDWANSRDLNDSGNFGLSERDSDVVNLNDENVLRGVLPTIYFDYAQSYLKPAEREKIIKAKKYLETNRNAELLLEGHCDWRGTKQYNLALGERRSSKVRAYLVELGINSQRIEVVSKGDLEAVVEGSESEMRLDRRVDILVVKGN